MIHNTDPAKVDLHAVKGDTIDMVIYVNSELLATGRKFYASALPAVGYGVAYNLGDLKIQVRRKDGLLLKEWISGVSPSDIVITDNYFHLYDVDGFLESGHFDYDVEETIGVNKHCIMSGSFYVKKEITL